VSGAPLDNGARPGSAYIFERAPDGNWQQVAKILPLDGAAGDTFGESVSLNGDRLAVGAFRTDDNKPRSGSAYVFDRDAGGNWVQVTKILPLDGDRADEFGGSVALDGDRVLVGAERDNANGPDSGSAYIFEPVLVSPQLSITGTCPGEITVASSGTTPRSGVRLYHSANEGGFTLVGGDCDGTQVDLDAPDLAREGNTDFTPDFTLPRRVDEFWCGRYLQMLDENTCLTSEVVQVP